MQRNGTGSEKNSRRTCLKARDVARHPVVRLRRRHCKIVFCGRSEKILIRMSSGKIAMNARARLALRNNDKRYRPLELELWAGKIDHFYHQGKRMPTESHGEEIKNLTRKSCLVSCAAEMHHGQAPTGSCAEKRRRCNKYTCKHQSTVDAVPNLNISDLHMGACTKP